MGTVQVMSIIFIMWVGGVHDDGSPNKQSDGERGDMKFKMRESSSVIYSQNRCTDGQCQIGCNGQWC